MKLHVLMQVAVLGLLAGCGGGGGGDGGSGSNNGPITAQNAPVVASAAQSAISESSDGGTSGTNFFVASVSGGPAKDFNLGDLAIDQVLRLRKSAGLITAAATNPCATSGTVTDNFSNNDTNPEFTAGDTLSLSFDNCVEGGVLLDGALTIALNSLSGDPAVPGSNYSLTISVAFNNFVVDEGDESGEINGSLTVSANRSGNIETITVSSSALTIRDTSTASGQVLALNGFSVTEEYNEATGSYAISVTGTLNDSRIGFNVVATTITPLVSDDFGDPTSGSIRLTAGDGTSVTLTATGGGINGDEVRLEVDTNGDGTIDSTLNTSWTALGALS